MPTQSAEVTLKGLSPLLMHSFPMVPVEAIEKKTPQEQAELSTYRTPDKQLYIPGVNIQRAFVSAATYSKGKGRGNLSRPAAACLMVNPEYVIIDPQTFTVDSRPVVIAATKGRILRHRPRFDKWEIKFQVCWDDLLLKESEVKRIIEDACSRVGFLDFRPEKKGPFGRAMVTRFEKN